MWMSILKTPLAYGVPSGPVMVPDKWFKLEPTGLLVGMTISRRKGGEWGMLTMSFSGRSYAFRSAF